MQGDEVLYEVRSGTARLTLNREASRNSLDAGTIGLMDAALDSALADDTVRAVCITGIGDRVFCSGADLGSALAGGDPSEGPRRYALLLRRILDFPKPVVARVNGHCMGGGLGLMLACDLAFAREEIRIGTPEVKVGLFPMMVAPLLLRAVPRQRAMEMMLTGEPVDAVEAQRIGLVSRVVPSAEFDTTVDSVLAAICANAPVAIRMGRQAIREVEGGKPGTLLELMSGKLLDLLQTEDAAEGLTAFLEKRPPKWKGR